MDLEAAVAGAQAASEEAALAAEPPAEPQPSAAGEGAAQE